MRRCSTRALSTITAAAAAVILTPGAASASVTVPLHDAHEGASAADFASGDCARENSAPPAGSVRWVFVLPHHDADFASLALTFRTATWRASGDELIQTCHPGWTSRQRSTSSFA